MADERDLVRARISIVDLVGQRVQLKKQGKDWKGLCPFHNDKNPSFQVSPITGTYRCWSCGAKGDVFNWVMETQKVDFREALEILARQAGIELGARTDAQRSRRASLENAMKCAHAYFVDHLTRDALAQGYCEKRGLGSDVLDSWGIGSAPSDRQSLTLHLKKSGFSLADCKELFLVDGSQEAGYYDRFSGRLIIPIYDERGALVAFGGRIMGPGEPKYINSSDTPLYSKRRVLYGMHRAKEHISSAGLAVLVEGYLDVIACHRAGVVQAVASLGTSLSEDHAALLKRWCQEVVVLYDSDAAGQKASERAADVLAMQGLRVRIAPLPEGEDPDSLLKAAGPGAVSKCVEGGLSPLEFRLGRIRQALKPDSAEYWPLVVQALSTAASPLELEKHLLDVAMDYPGIRDPVAAKEALRRQVDAERRKAKQPQVPEEEDRPKPIGEVKIPGPERAILLAACDPVLREATWPLLVEPDLITHKIAARLVKALVDAHGEVPPQGDALAVLSGLSDLERSVMSDLLMKQAAPIAASDVSFAAGRLHKLKEIADVRRLRMSQQPEDVDLESIARRLRSLHDEE